MLCKHEKHKYRPVVYKSELYGYCWGDVCKICGLVVKRPIRRQSDKDHLYCVEVCIPSYRPANPKYDAVIGHVSEKEVRERFPNVDIY